MHIINNAMLSQQKSKPILMHKPHSIYAVFTFRRGCMISAKGGIRLLELILRLRSGFFQFRKTSPSCHFEHC